MEANAGIAFVAGDWTIHLQVHQTSITLKAEGDAACPPYYLPLYAVAPSLLAPMEMKSCWMSLALRLIQPLGPCDI